MRLFDLSQSPSARELASFEKPERYTTASFRRLIPSASSGTRHSPATMRIGADVYRGEGDPIMIAIIAVLCSLSSPANCHEQTVTTSDFADVSDAVLSDRRTAAGRLDESASDRAPCGMALRVR